MGVQANDDWYEVSLAPGNKRLIADLYFTHAGGNIDLDVVDGAGNVKASSASATDHEHIDYVLPATGTWYLRVSGAHAGNTYDLWWRDRYVHPGDASMNGKTDISDLNIWMQYRFQAGTDWTKGDFNGDGKTDVSDLNVWMQYRFTAAPGGLSLAAPSGAIAAAREAPIAREPAGRQPALGKMAWLCDFDALSLRNRSPKKPRAVAAAVDKILAGF